MAYTNTPNNAMLLTAPQPGQPVVGALGGPSASRPAGPVLGQLYFDTTLGYEIVWNSVVWAPVVPPQPNPVLYGPTSGRPVNPYNGQPYFNTTLGGLECWSGSLWLFIGPGATQSTAPTIVTQPASLTVAAGSAASFTVSASGSGTLSYQWYFNGVAIGGAITNSYSIGSAAVANGGNYYVIVTGSGGSTQSGTAVLTVTGSPAITSQPTSQTVTAGNSVSFTVVATGTNPLSYQWYYNSSPISGAVSATYAINPVTAGNAGNYYVTVTNTAGSATSNTVSLTVNPAPGMTAASFSAVCAATSTTSTIIGYSYTNGGPITVTLSSTSGNLPAGCQLQAYSSSGAVIGGATATSTGATSSLTITYTLSGTATGTVGFITQSTFPIVVQFTATAGGSMVFTNFSLRATVWGSAIYGPAGLAMSLTSTTVTPGSIATVEFMDGVSTTSYKSNPNYSWNLQGQTTSNPYVGFTVANNTINVTGYAGSAIVSDSRLDVNSGSATG